MKRITVGYSSISNTYGIVDGLAFVLPDADFVLVGDESLDKKVREYLDRKGLLNRRLEVQYFVKEWTTPDNAGSERLADLVCRLNSKAKKVKIKKE